jgi:hypothetical protein
MKDFLNELSTWWIKVYTCVAQKIWLKFSEPKPKWIVVSDD